MLDLEKVPIDSTVHLSEVKKVSGVAVEDVSVDSTFQPAGTEKVPNEMFELVGNGKKRIITILKKDSGKLQNDELLESDPVARKLLGHKKNDVVEFKQSDLEVLSFKIVEIQSKYVYAFQQSLSEFSFRFPRRSWTSSSNLC